VREFLCAFVFLWLIAPAYAQDPISVLATKLKSKETRLEHEPQHGYLLSVLKQLNVPISSQTLVFSKTSLQSEHISPKTPRALYFNDDVYVAWVQDAAAIEIMAVDPKRGANFYMLDQENDGRPVFEQVTGHVCSACHYDQSMKKFVPHLSFLSVIPDETGNVEGTSPVETTDLSLIEERWGGWYVTGTHGTQRHLGNIALKTPRSIGGTLSGIDFSKSSNVTDLGQRFDTTKYLSPHSDIVALLVLAHQVDVHNLIARASAQPDADPKETGEPLVKALLFAGAAPFKGAVKGTSAFASDFSDRGPRDSRGRSLREFDLKTRLFRYPLSYMVYSSAFDAMPDRVRNYVYRRLTEVLTGKDQTPDFMHLSRSDRTAILEILRDTKSDFPREQVK